MTCPTWDTSRVCKVLSCNISHAEFGKVLITLMFVSSEELPPLITVTVLLYNEALLVCLSSGKPCFQLVLLSLLRHLMSSLCIVSKLISIVEHAIHIVHNKARTNYTTQSSKLGFIGLYGHICMSVLCSMRNFRGPKEQMANVHTQLNRQKRKAIQED